MDFIVLDTEGNPNLTELAIVDSQGVVIYEGFCDGNSHGFQNVLNLKSLKTVLTDFLNIVEDKKIICHYAEHVISSSIVFDKLVYLGKISNLIVLGF